MAFQKRTDASLKAVIDTLRQSVGNGHSKAKVNLQWHDERRPAKTSLTPNLELSHPLLLHAALNFMPKVARRAASLAKYPTPNADQKVRLLHCSATL